MKRDIVYILKNDIKADELKYSLRSVEQNFPYRKIWFYGGCPDGIKPDEYVEIQQVGDSKWQKATSMIKAACLNDDITEDFWLFNDDFFVMKQVRSLRPYTKGTLQETCKRIEQNNKGLQSAYTRRLRSLIHLLKQNGLDQVDYALHMPMLINREKALEVFERFPDNPMFRGLYGNYWSIGGKVIEDVKVSNVDEMPKDTKFISTNDASFRIGKVGEVIRSRFPTPSKYEILSD